MRNAKLHFLLLSVFVLALLYIFVARMERNINTETENGFQFPVVQTATEVFVAAEFVVQDFDSEIGDFESALQLNDEFIQLVKTKKFDGLHEFFSLEDGSRDRYSAMSEFFNETSNFNSIEKVKYNFGIAWGDYQYLSVEYTDKNGNVRGTREDFFCPTLTACKKTMSDMGQAFEISYLRLNEYLQSQTGILQKSENFHLSDKLDEVHDSVVEHPHQSKGVSRRNDFTLNIGLKRFDSVVCKDCDNMVNEILESEQNLLSSFAEFIEGLNDLNFTDYESLFLYIESFDETYERTTAFPTIRWKNGVPTNVFSNIVAYLSRMKSWPGGTPLGYIDSNDGVFIFIRFDNGESSDLFDLEIIFLGKNTSGQYVFRPTGNEESLTQTFIRSPEFLGPLKMIFSK